MKKSITIVFVILFLLSSMTMVNVEEEAQAAPTRLVKRFFAGNISGLHYGNPDGIPDVYGLNITGTYLGNGTSFSQLENIKINLSNNGSFIAAVDAEFHDSTLPWNFILTDCYGWEEAGGGIVPITNTSTWDPINTTQVIPDGTLWYRKGFFGDMNITAINGTSGEPLEGVGFSFTNHPLHNSRNSGNYTDYDGEALFKNMQIGLNLDNIVTVNIDKGNFTYNDGNGTNIAKLLLRNNTQTNHTLVLTENDLIRSSAPTSGQIGIPVNRNQVPNNVFVQFHHNMDKTTIDQDTLYLKERNGEKVNITYIWPTNDLVKIQPENDLKYNTVYDIFVTPRVKNQMGYEPLWRTFSFNFTTILPPASIRCEVLVNGTFEPAPDGTMIQLGNNVPEMLVDGEYQFDNVVEGTYSINVIGPTVGGVSEYLYYGNTVSGIVVERGELLDIDGLFVFKRPVRTAIIEVLDQNGDPLEGANVTHQITRESRFTGMDGKATFSDVLIHANTTFRASRENYNERPVTVRIGSQDPTIVNVTLYEKDLPVNLKARSEFLFDIDGRKLPVDSDIQLEFKGGDGFSVDMDEDTMTSDNLKILDDEGNPIPIDIVPRTTDMSKWTLEPRNLLEYDSKYTIFVSEQVTTIYGENPLWRDLEVEFITQDLDSSFVSGRVTIREKEVGGVRIDVLDGDEVLGTGETDSNGNYLVEVDHHSLTMMDIHVRADGTKMGLETKIFGPVALNSGGRRNFTDFQLSRLDDWYNVLYPKDDEGRMPVQGSITLKFKTVLDNSDPEAFANNFTFRSINIPLNITLTEGGKTVIIRPERDLDYDKIYTLYISDFSRGDFYKEMVDVNGTPALIRGDVIEIITEFKPIDVILQAPSTTLLDNTPVNIPLSVFFTNYSVNTALIEESIELKQVSTGRDVENLTFSWSTNKKSLDIGHDDFKGLTEYMLRITAGKYGEGASQGARIHDDFIVYFTTEPVSRNINPIKIWPTGKVGAKTTITLENPEAIEIMVVISIEEEFGSREFVEYANVTLAPAESDRQVILDTEELGGGSYMTLIRIYDPDNGILLYEYPMNLDIEKDDSESDDDMFWVFIVVGAIIILIAILAVFLFLQSRKKELDEELKEEFECPECHHLVGEDDAVCPHCGAEFEEQAYKCPKCGSMLDPEDDECPECGYDFEDQDKMVLEDEEDDIEMELEEEDEE